MDKVLNFYKNCQEYSVNILSSSGLLGGGFFSMLGAGEYCLANLGVLAGFGQFFAAQQWISEGMYLFFGGISFASVFILAACGSYYLFNKTINKKDNYIKEIKEFQNKLNDQNSLEYKIIDSFLKKIYKNLEEKLTELIKDEYYKMKEIINNLEFESQEIYNKYGEKILIKVKERLPNFHKLNKMSILVLGKTGVGKTTLINSILNKKQKENSIGLPQQMDTPIIKNNNIDLFPTLDIYDTRGIELSQNFNIDNFSKEIISFIKNGLNKEDNNDKNPIDFIHCIWYCITGTRVENSEIQYIRDLQKSYSSEKKLPIIFVYTLAINKKFSEELKNTLIKEFNDKDLKFIEVLTEPYIIEVEENSLTLKKKGLKNLFNESLKLCQLGIESSFYGKILNLFKNSINHYLYIKPY